MTIDTIIDELTDIIREDDFFSKIKVVKAYPFRVKPTRLERAYISLGINEINMHSCHIDSNGRVGEISVFADIFVPVSADDNYIPEIFSRLCSVLSRYNVLSVSASRICYDTDIQANVLKTTISFSGEICFGGECNEQ